MRHFIVSFDFEKSKNPRNPPYPRSRLPLQIRHTIIEGNVEHHISGHTNYARITHPTFLCLRNYLCFFGLLERAKSLNKYPARKSTNFYDTDSRIDRYYQSGAITFTMQSKRGLSVSLDPKPTARRTFVQKHFDGDIGL